MRALYAQHAVLTEQRATQSRRHLGSLAFGEEAGIKAPSAFRFLTESCRGKTNAGALRSP